MTFTDKQEKREFIENGLIAVAVLTIAGVFVIFFLKWPIDISTN
jgi:hypothetical protein